ncbi:diguanylate cyclase (GGDEF) domain-containing protein [Palleronia marisminoris]|uniref:Cyclic di-GMP phosphodiesterase Gmr n=1 Tax=Palleronia marisminoris TaxID=315423 RepID=A0A1Y5RBM8_9RHOB|nr:diguanylate cyclase [Palleronia marisminoris]SFG11293.1 diguanylate cyclase (GGDEF) domain-containing protein [Palleronia marisminoris]SLN13625.1 Cyclic di-GMP phosphodiesterase Gmr [Palleronia marisminoris]
MPDTNIAQPLRRQVLLSILVLFVFGTLPVILIGTTSVDRIDRKAAAREKSQAVAAVERRFERLAVEQRNATVWDEAVGKVAVADTAWMENNVGVWMQEYFGHDMSFVLDPALTPIYAAAELETRSPDAFDQVEGVVAPMAASARDMILQGDIAPEEIAVTSYVTLATGPAIASVVPIIPDTDALDVVPRSTHFHVAVDYLDDTYLAAVTEGLALAAPSIDTRGGSRHGVVAMKDARGTEIARLTWRPSAPASDLVAAMSPALLLWLGGGALLVFFLARRLIGTSYRLQASEAHARHLAFHDPLTGLPNRALFEDRLGQALAMADRGGADVTLLMLDLDRFKAVNDRLGHPAGDELIRQVGERLASRIRRSDTVARLGGDEFALILVGDVDAAAFDAFCKDVIVDISRPYDLFGEAASVSASIGASRARPGEDAGELIRCADIALYQAKDKGRERHCVFVDGMGARSPMQGRWEQAHSFTWIISTMGFILH